MSEVLTMTVEFTRETERYRHELRVHCYRLLGSFDEAEDLVQETLLRAWRSRDTFEGRSTLRAWLYRIATNACLDAIHRRPALTPTAGEPVLDVPWLQPYPDVLLDQAAGPDAEAVAKETIELAFLAALQHLPAKQRAVLVLRDVLGWPAAETAALLEDTVPAVNSALQRARVTLRKHLPERRAEWSADPSAQEKAVVRRFVEATENGDMAALAAVLREDAVWTMPPQPEWHRGRDELIGMWTPIMVGPEAFGEWRAVETWANRQPAVANYVKRPGSEVFEPVALDVLRVEDGLVTQVLTFGPAVFERFGLPATL
ncbi:RNA polymerase subunit sigma-70 [Saccharothrix variisporea]|uniref:RNA polymerase sigma factor n=1 Tax=Saccharothrix variisporea TaxID=543527 RepID=A0A495X2Q0_9PSEU|nr:RNA polymerase subunit sigma-70 [Saccharothrix variisporea]RKT68250.1 RNA polymerase ECF family sigma subunit [Saccharothrix variisporea]